LAEVGADGIHFDKVFGHPVLNFNPGPGLSPDQSWYTGVLRCLEETLEAGRRVRPDFALSVESSWDRLLTYCDAWWQWHDMLDHVPVMKYTFPEFMPIFPVVQPWDYNNVNNAIRYGYQILVGPVRYSASMADDQMREISAYVAEVLRGDWVVSGDLFRRDADGFFWYAGRADDVISSGAYRIGPFEVESALLEHPAVQESAVVGSPDADRGNIVKAFIVLRPGFEASDALVKELQDHCKRVTAPYKYPRAIEFVAELPKTRSGKIRRVELRQAELRKKGATAASGFV